MRRRPGLAVNAALTGHIVLSTLHTNSSVGVIPRLMDMGVQAVFNSVNIKSCHIAEINQKFMPAL